MLEPTIARALSLLSLGALLACGEGYRGESGDSGTSLTGSQDPTDTEGDPDDSGGDTGTEEKLDVGLAQDLPGTEEEGCSKVDFLFVIDNSASMQSQQGELVDAFPKFIDTIRNEVAAQDYRILVTDSDGGDGIEQPQYYGCDGAPGALGAGIRRQKSGHGPLCGFDTDASFMTHNQTDLEDTFACVARVGTAGWGLEYPMSAMATAVGPDLTGAGGCNEGFVRDDAVLVVTVITDDPDLDGKASDDAGAGDPQAWYDAVVGAKHGDPSAVVMLGLVPNGDPLRGTTELFVELVEMFGDRGVLGEVMAPDYGPFFEEAVGKIDEACDSFVPPG